MATEPRETVLLRSAVPCFAVRSRCACCFDKAYSCRQKIL